MEFSELLKKYMERAGVSAVELAGKAGLSPSSVSRYLNGKQTPGEDVIRRLARALAQSFSEQSSENALYQDLYQALSGIQADYDSCLENVRQLLSLLEISNHELALLMAYDPSYISRILSGSRKLSNLAGFLNRIADYISHRCFHTPEEDSLLKMIHHEGEISDEAELARLLLGWLGSTQVRAPSQMEGFLRKLDDFSLNEFKSSIHFDEIRVPTVPFQLPTIRTYYGIEQMKQAELDFLKAVVLSRSMEDVILYSDMPIQEMSEDEDFFRKWMTGLAMMLRKGLTLQMIHDVHRPVNEMLLGLEGWIPMYMTGQVRPYYLRDQTNQQFLHFIRSGGSVAISGEAISGHQADGRYIVSRNAQDVDYYRKRARDLLGRAQPLMEIYRREDEGAFHAQMQIMREREKRFVQIGAAPPLFTMTARLLDRILDENHVQDSLRKRIRAMHADLQAWAQDSFREEADESSPDRSYIFEWQQSDPASREAFPIRLALSALFPDGDICYGEETYRLHMEQTLAYAASHKSFFIWKEDQTSFRNIDICICPGRHVLVSKSNTPAIHFLIFHPKMVRSFEDFIPAGTSFPSDQSRSFWA